MTDTRQPAPTDRNQATTHLLRFFDYHHLPEHLRAISYPSARLAVEMAGRLPDGPELTAGLRKLLEAKDCFVRAALDLERTETAS